VTETGPPPLAPRSRRPLTRRLALPLVSGKGSVAVLLGCLVLSALVIPLAARLPAWVEFELVLVAWWLAWVLVLAHLLYRGRRLSDDYAWRPARSWVPGAAHILGEAGSSAGDAGSGCLQSAEEACLLLLALALLIGAAWLLLEVAVPALAFLAYALVRGMLARIANDRHGCERSLHRAFAWAVLWATTYTVPLSAIVWGVHVWMRSRPA